MCQWNKWLIGNPMKKGVLPNSILVIPMAQCKGRNIPQTSLYLTNRIKRKICTRCRGAPDTALHSHPRPSSTTPWLLKPWAGLLCHRYLIPRAWSWPSLSWKDYFCFSSLPCPLPHTPESWQHYFENSLWLLNWNWKVLSESTCRFKRSKVTLEYLQFPH